jgi:hypothetical protein
LILISEYQKASACRAIPVDWPAAGLRKGNLMQPSICAPQHFDVLRELLARGMSYSQIADAINEKFGTCYTRSGAGAWGLAFRSVRMTG